MTDPATGGELVGRRVRLRPTTAADHPRLIAIRRTEEVHRRWQGDDLEAELAADLHEPDVYRFTIVVPSDPSARAGEGAGDEMIVGMVQYGEETDPQYRSASVDIYVDPAHHRRGYATDAIRTLVDHLFDHVGHHRISIDPAADNAAAIACYSKVGFRPVGVLRSYEHQLDGTWADGLLMDMIESDRTDRADRADRTDAAPGDAEPPAPVR